MTFTVGNLTIFYECHRWCFAKGKRGVTFLDDATVDKLWRIRDE